MTTTANTTKTKTKILAILGTRPEAVKMAPIILALREESDTFTCRVVATAQHRELLDQVLATFEIRPDVDFDIMEQDQRLAGLTARLLPRLDELLETERPDWVLAQGDTTTVFAAALACYYRQVRFAHVEAGLRTGNKYFPFPEEINRVLAGQLADLHFTPTRQARRNLLREGVPEDRILVTGNPVVDALLQVRDKRGGRPFDLPFDLPQQARLILVTAHRRENFGEPLREICDALVELAGRFEDVHIVYPVHPNPNVARMTGERLGGRERIHLIAPMSYPDFVAAMDRSTLILSDSGGVQEEAPSLGKPVLVLRDETERPEAVEAGTVKLVGPHRATIVEETARLLNSTEAYERMARAINPYGDGQAARRIRDALAGRTVSPFEGG
ncbi:MAG: UDP-N-acetylglucosamine 2-epimerase (non-hydrolyzing) [bacterium]